MRIRSIKPEFWRSDDINNLSREYRLLFIGLWSYVDDNGVGVDDHRRIAADLFALEDDQKEVRDFVREGLATLSRASLVARYEVDGKRYIHVRSWRKHQKVDRPNKERYPEPPSDWKPPTSEDVPVREDVARVSTDVASVSPSGAVEQGNRGRTTSATADALTLTEITPPAPDEDAEFEAWWKAWPRKDAKADARKAYKAARRKKVPAELLLNAAAEQLAAWKAEGKDPKFVPYGATWLRGERYNDEIVRPKFTVITNSASPWAGTRIPAGNSPWAEDMGWTS